MNEWGLVWGPLLVAAAIEGRNGLLLGLRTRRALSSVGLEHGDGPALIIQEFGVYSLALSLAYVSALFLPAWRTGIAAAGILVNASAALLHLARSRGLYVGDAKPLLDSRSERNAGVVHGLSLASLLIAAGFGGSDV